MLTSATKNVHLVYLTDDIGIASVYPLLRSKIKKKTTGIFHWYKDITHFFFDENSFSAPIESIFYNKPDRYGRQVLEETVLRTIHFRDWSELCTENRQLKELAFLMAIDVCRLFADRIFSLQFQTAQERYKDLIANYPSILLRAPLGHIASYLGITQQTLSVIRSVK